MSQARAGAATRPMLAILAVGALLLSLFSVLAQPARAADTGHIAVFKTMCQSFGQQDTCNGRNDSLDGYHIDYTVHAWNGETAGDLEETIVVTLGENAGGGGNTGGGSQGRSEGGALASGTYLVCEIEVAYLGDDEVGLEALPRPEPGNGGSTGGSQLEHDGNCIIVDVATGTSELKFLDKTVDTGSLVVLKTDDDPDEPTVLSGATFSVTDSEENPVEGSPQATGTDGTVCFDGLALGTEYTVTETIAPTGYAPDEDGPALVEVTVAGDCEDRGGVEDTADVVFTNTLIPPTPLVPTLVISKAASVDSVSLTGPASAPVASPSTITWTLTYTLTNGPIDNAVISDTLPAGLDYVAGSATAGGFTLSGDGRTLTWSFPTLNASGSVSFQTTVNVATISRTGPTENVAIIDSDDTSPDDGRDSVTVNVQTTVLAGNPTPKPSPAGGTVPNTAATKGFGMVPIGLLALLLVASLGALGYRNLVEVRRRR